MIVEDQTAIRQMLSTFVGADPGFSVVAEAADAPEAIRKAAETKPEIVVLDWMLVAGTGQDVLRALRNEPHPPSVLVFSANVTELAVRQALSLGALGYIEKTAAFSEFTTALRAVAAGKVYFGPAVARVVQTVLRNRGSMGTQESALSARECDILRFVAEGLASKEIASRLNLSVRTVENHRASISRKTGLRSVAQLTLHALELGLVSAPVARE